MHDVKLVYRLLLGALCVIPGTHRFEIFFLGGFLAKSLFFLGIQG